MRGVVIFSGSSHPVLASAICERLGMQVAGCELTKFSNGETSVSIGPSTRNFDVFIVQSGSKAMNDSVMELLIMASACKGGSAKSITAVLPYFPYCRQSKKKSHRGAITARMLANLLTVAGVKHVITVDLHADPIKGFFGCPVDNLRAEPLIARWIKSHVPDWQTAVVVSKNAGGSKRVTSMADALKLSFGIITTDRRRDHHTNGERLDATSTYIGLKDVRDDIDSAAPMTAALRELEDFGHESPPRTGDGGDSGQAKESFPVSDNAMPPRPNRERASEQQETSDAPLDSANTGNTTSPSSSRTQGRPNMSLAFRNRSEEEHGEIFTDERARDVIQGRFIQGHIVDDNYPSPAMSAVSSAIGFSSVAPGTPAVERQDPMTMSLMSTVSSLHHDGLGGAGEGGDDDDDASLQNPEIEHTITLVGNVKNRTVFLIDDMIDRSEAWIAAAETVVKRGGAKQVYCIATHGLFGGDCLEQIEQCECINYVVVCNTFPIDADRVRLSTKLIILDLSGLISEAIRRNHFGESISTLYQFYQD